MSGQCDSTEYDLKNYTDGGLRVDNTPRSTLLFRSYDKNILTAINLTFPSSFACSSASLQYKELVTLADFLQIAVVIGQVLRLVFLQFFLFRSLAISCS